MSTGKMQMHMFTVYNSIKIGKHSNSKIALFECYQGVKTSNNRIALLLIDEDGETYKRQQLFF